MVTKVKGRPYFFLSPVFGCLVTKHFIHSFYTCLKQPHASDSDNCTTWRPKLYGNLFDVKLYTVE